MAGVQKQLRDFLIAEGHGRVPATAAAGKHPIWLEPKGGAIGLNESPEGNATEKDADLVISLFGLPGRSTGAFEGDTYRYNNIEIRMRARVAPIAYAWEEAIRPDLHDRRGWEMAGMPIIESLIFREMTPIDFGEQGYTYAVEYSFQRYV